MGVVAHVVRAILVTRLLHTLDHAQATLMLSGGVLGRALPLLAVVNLCADQPGLDVGHLYPESLGLLSGLSRFEVGVELSIVSRWSYISGVVLRLSILVTVVPLVIPTIITLVA